MLFVVMSDQLAKKRRKEADAAFPKLGGIGVDYSAVADRQIEDKRFEREKSVRPAGQPVNSSSSTSAVSSTFDAFQRLAAGLEGRKIADKIADPNRPTW